MTLQPGVRNRALYRVGQFVRGLSAHVSVEEMAEATDLLPPAAADLFCSLPRDARRHSLNVLHFLRAQGAVDADLAAAALLHDSGKLAAEQAGLPLTLWLRGPLVLLDALAPALARRLARSEGKGWRRLLFVHRQHATIGARWAHERGCSARTVWLIANHQTSAPQLGPDGRSAVSAADLSALHALQSADDRN